MCIFLIFFALRGNESPLFYEFYPLSDVCDCNAIKKEDSISNSLNVIAAILEGADDSPFNNFRGIVHDYGLWHIKRAKLL
jgi:hypothetical protein